MEEILAGEALARPQYISCAHPLTLQELDIIRRSSSVDGRICGHHPSH